MLDWRRGLPMLVATAVATLGAALIFFLPDNAMGWRENGLDRLVGLMPLPSSAEILVIDIGPMSDTGAPWSRTDTARLMTAIADAAPKAVALDIVLSANCAVSPTNEALAEAISRVPTTLGFLLGTAGGEPQPRTDIASGQGLALPLIWQAPEPSIPVRALKRQLRAAAPLRWRAAWMR